MDNANANDLPCCCFSDDCAKCNTPEFQESQKATRERRLTIPEHRRDAGPAEPAASPTLHVVIHQESHPDKHVRFIGVFESEVKVQIAIDDDIRSGGHQYGRDDQPMIRKDYEYSVTETRVNRRESW